VSAAAPTGVVLAGGRGRRLGGPKATVELAGRPLLHHVLDALRAALPVVAVVAKRDTALPDLPPGVALWHEPDAPRHPLTGIVHALRAAGGAVLVCAVDLPLVTASLVSALAAADLGERPAVVARAEGRMQPLFAVYATGALAQLEAAPPDQPLTDTVAALGPAIFGVSDPRALLNVNTAADLEAAERALAL
jgi:molybdopterin-guanine dinucleotide biosynthesis protein A